MNSNYTIKYKSGSSDVDISTYVLEAKDIPYVVRNPDWTIVFDGYNLTLSSAYPQISSIREDTQLYVYSSSVLIHNGRVDEILYDYSKRSYKLKIKHAGLNLQDKLYNKDNINDYLPTYPTVLNDNTHSMCRHNDIITACFSASSFTLDWTSAHYVTGSMPFHATRGFSYSGGSTVNYNNIISLYPDELLYLPEAMYCINQPKVWSPRWLKYNDGDTGSLEPNPNTGASDQMITCFDMVNILSTIYGYNFIPKDSGSFYVLSKQNAAINISIPSSEIYSRKDKKYRGAEGAKVQFDSLTLWTEGVSVGDSSPFYGYGRNRWFPKSGSMRYYISEIAYYNGLQTDQAGRNVVYSNSYLTGSKAKNLKWYNHLVPVGIVSDTTYLVYPNVEFSTTVVRNQRHSVLTDGTEYTIDTLSKNYWSQSYKYQLQSVTFKDLRGDEIELVWRDNL